MARPSRRLVADAVADRLAAITPTTVGYFAQIGRPLNASVATTTPKDPPPKSATDPRVQPYFVLYPGGGTDGPDANLGDETIDLTQAFPITAAAGDIDDLLALVDRIDARLNRWSPVIGGYFCGPLRPLPGFNPGLLVDQQFSPARLYIPMQYLLTATT